jgi:hypothetical protein
MKQKIIGSLIGCALALLAPQIVQAQGTMNVLSNLDQTSAGSLAVGSDSWLAFMFGTGTNSAGYTLNSIQLEMTDATGSPNGFTVMLYTGGNFPFDGSIGSSIATLDGSLNPAAGGLYTYTPDTSLTLSPGTDYFIVLTAGTTVANGAYDWSYASTSSYNPSGHWGVIGAAGSSNGSVWHSVLGEFPQFDINATPVPEPGVLSLSGLGGLAFLCHRRKSKQQ